MIRFERWSDAEKAYALAHLQTPPPPNSVACKKDRLEARRHCNNFAHIPRWKSNASTCNTDTTPNHCIYPLCKTTSKTEKIILPSIPQSTLIEYLQVDTLPEGLHGLCKKHYCEVYNWLHQPASYASCGARPKAGTRFSRHSPNPSLISKLLNQSAEMEIDLTAKDAICYSCYRVHLSLINSTQSSDEQLEEFMQIWLETFNDVNTSILTKSILRAVLVVGDNLLRQRAVLLPQVSQVFFNTYGAVTAELEVENTEVKLSSRWLLHQLLLHLNNFMECRCEHRHVGTVLFRRGGNIKAQTTMKAMKKTWSLKL